MKKRFWITACFLMIFSITSFLFYKGSLSMASDGSPDGNHWWDKLGTPKYGGSINIRVTGFNPAFDPGYLPGLIEKSWWFETLFMQDWTLDREIFRFTTQNVPETGYWKGLLAEGWEQNDPSTITLHIRKGVHWQNRPPVNGREFTAADVENNFHRDLGRGSGYVQPNMFMIGVMTNIEAVMATDKYTVVVNFKKPLNVIGLHQFFSTCTRLRIGAPELIQEAAVPAPPALPGGGPPPGGAPPPGGPPPGGPPPGGKAPKLGPELEWKDALGTGPWILSDYIPGVSVTLTKNPDYWGHDERYPQNRLPYVESSKQIFIEDLATAMAAIRSGKVDFIVDIPWNQAASLLKTNPDLLQWKVPTAGLSLDIRLDREPFTDIRVRKALNMAIDRQAIAKNYYGGLVDGTPMGILSPAIHKGWVVPFAQWPAELQQEYTYNPRAAKKLLADAGYPEGFKTNVIASSGYDLQLLQAIKAQFMDIGVDMEIRAMDMATADEFARSGKHDQMSLNVSTGKDFPAWDALQEAYYSKGSRNYVHANDPVFDAMVDNFGIIPDQDKAVQNVKEADLYVLKQHWEVFTVPVVKFIISQPYLKGYSGEYPFEYRGAYFARFWIDK